MEHLGRVCYLGAVTGERGEALNIRQFAVTTPSGPARNTPLYLILGTSSEVGKTTAGTALVRTLRLQAHTNVVALKLTGTSSFGELARYLDFGATEAFDCIDFGFPTTYPVGRIDIVEFFFKALDYCLSLPADAVIVECAGDPVSANAPKLLECVKARRPEPKIILAAADALGALGARQALADVGLAISLITGPCTDTEILRQWTEDLCGIPAINMARGDSTPDETTEDPGEIRPDFALDTPELAATYEVVGHQQLADGKELISALHVTGGEHVLDIGAGTGHLAAHVLEIVGPSGRVVAIDPLPLRVEIAQSKAAGNLDVRVGRAEDLSEFADASFDVIYLNCVFHWIEDKSRALAEIFRVLKAGGRLGLNCQDVDHPHEAFDFVRRAMIEAGVKYYYGSPSASSRELEALVAGVGFVAYDGELRRFVNSYRDVDSLLAWASSSSFGNFLANVTEGGRARVRDALARELEPKRSADGDIQLRRYLLFATARKPAN
jgi:arsenite methyltransferase